MNRFMSWLKKKNGDIFYLDSKKINSIEGKRRLEGLKYHDLIGYEAIKRFYGLEGILVGEYTNRSFWNGEIPKVMKKAWNSGKFDGMLKYLNDYDIDDILESAPEDYSYFVLKNKEPDLLTNEEEYNKMIPWLMERKYNKMMDSNDLRVQIIGGLISNNYGFEPTLREMGGKGKRKYQIMDKLRNENFNKMKRSKYRCVRMLGKRKEELKGEVIMDTEGWRTWIIDGLMNENFNKIAEDMEKSYGYHIQNIVAQIISGIFSKNYNRMIRSDNLDIRKVGVYLKFEHYLRLDVMGKREIKRPKIK